MTVDSVTGRALHTVPWPQVRLATTPAGGPGAQSLPLTRRLRPPGPCPHLVERPRLLDRVSRALQDAPLALLSAPAGYGKTVLAGAWARRFGARRPVAWLSVAERDDQPSTFWSHVVVALSLVGAITADVSTALLADASDGFDVEELGELLLCAGLPVVLVLDAAERVRNRAIFDQLARLLESADDRLRLLITTRQDPPMPLHRYRLDGTVSEIRYDDLAFTDDEARTLLELHHVDGSDSEASRLLRRVEGWPAGLRWTALAMPSGVAELRLDDSAADYLAAEVLDELPESDRDLLLGVSLVVELPPDLACALTDRPDADAALQRLSAGNTFVQVLPGRPGHRLQPMARRFLAARLERSRPGAVADLHRRAADWFAAHGRPSSAIDHAAAIGDDSRRQLYQALLAGSDGSTLMRAGDLDAACARLRVAAEAASAVLREDLRRDFLARLALAEACRGHLSAVPGLVEVMQDSGETAATARLAVAWVGIEQHQLGRAREALTSAARPLEGVGGDALLDEVATLLRARLLRDRGDSAGARQVLGAVQPQIGWLRQQLWTEAAAVGLPPDALERLAAEHETATVPTTSQRVWDLLARAQSHSAEGRLSAARSELTKALSLARPERIRRPFVHLAPELRALIRADHKLLGLAGWLRPVENADGRVAEIQPAPIPTELSGRELEVLRQLSALLTTEEIAAELFISINTVRTHIRRILEKLSVSRRNEAVRRGRELGLI